ncbi:MAG: UDP-N-acetylmuramoyl-L-alanine--D-glutamate ligase [Pseudomonadota bacterium]
MIPLSHLSGQTVGVLGLGASGLATARALTASGVTVLCWDDAQKGRDAATEEGFTVAELPIPGIGLLVSSPGIPIAYPRPHPVIAKALAASIAVIGDVELFAQTRPALPSHQVIAITGTNGKSTTTALIGHCLESAGIAAQIGGNFGPPVLSLEPNGGVYVLEMSSFQLEQTQSLASDIAIFLNLTPDHGDRYGSFADYGAAKQRLFDMQGDNNTAVIALDDDEGRRLASQAEAAVVPISGVGAQGAEWAVIDGELAYHGRAISSQRDWPALKGPHNAQNAAAAAAACYVIGLSPDEIARGLETFGGLQHRSQRVVQVGDLTFVNDSKATNPDATLRSLQAFDNIFWLAGGSDKGSDFSLLNTALEHVKAAYFFGQTGPVLAEVVSLETSRVFDTLEDAFDAAVADATSTSEPATVLLSPACASFDQFRNFAHRGDVFTQLSIGAERKAA